jgi:PAS domain S-box-containing protein
MVFYKGKGCNMTEPLFKQSDHLRTLLDSMTSMVFVVDGELRILDANRAAARALGEKPELLLKRFCGDLLQCIHASESLGGCGSATSCQDCVIRQAAESVRHGQAVYKRRHRMTLQEGDEERDAFFLVTASPFEYNNALLSVIVLEDISELMELRSLVPICANCKMVRDDSDFWHHVERYMQKHMEVDFTHSICPRCKKLLYPTFA